MDTSTIRTVQVEGNQRIESRTIQSYMLVEPGDPFDPERLDLSLKALFATGLFVDINFTRSGDDLIVRVIENPVISRVLFEGNSSLSDDKLREEIQAAPRGIFTPARIQQDVRRMLELYRQDGRFGVKIEPQYKPLSQNRVDVIFSIEEGPRTGVRAINFIGNRAFSDDRLRQEIATKQSRLWRIFSSNDNYDPGRLEFDREQLRQLYQNRGYYDFRVISAVADLTPDQSDFYVTFTIEEGEQYTFGEFDIVTSFDRLDAERLKPLITARPGELYRGNMIEDTIDALTFAAGIAGYAFVDIRPQITADPETRTVNVTFAIDEGPRVYIDRININGNTNTLDRVIRRELRISEGDPYNRVLMERSRNRVRALRFFRSVELEEEPSTTPDRTIVNINVEETPTGEVSFAAGFSSTESFLIDLSIAQRNLVGTGRSGVARLSLSGQQQQLNFQFTEPRLFDRNLSGGVDLFAVRNDFLDQANFESTTIGTGVRVGFPVSERVQMGLRYRLQLDDIGIQDRNIIIDDEGELVASTIQNDDGTTREPEIGDVIDPENQLVDICDPLYRLRDASCASERSDLASIVGYSLNFDGRNDPIEPTGGFDFGFSQDIAGAGGDVRYLRTEVSSGWYRGLFRGVRAQARFSAGHILPWGGDEGVLINNRFFRGGSNFRGFDVAGLGPREVIRLFDPDTGEETELQRGNALGGTLYYQSTFEVTMPNFLPEEYGIKSALFLEAGGVGNLYDADYNDPLFFTDASGDDGVQFVETDPSLRASAGLTVFWTSPFGPIQFDFSHILKREDYDRTENFRFSTSTRF
ncbi:MAG: outer membrane protein assembly factor BamA [Henriciella sp.]|nr:outer membrane protein assembly factor BamA [Henriciella sp.]